MAQVRKFSNGTNDGGVTAQPDLFEWEGVGEYERKPMVQTLTKNLAAYADHLGLTGERRTRFLNNGAAAIKALEAGNIRRLSNGSYEDISKTMSSTGKYDKNWLGKLKDTDNNAYNDVAGYFNTYLGKASVYDPEKVKKEAEEKAKKDKVKFGGDAFLRQQLASGSFGGTFSEDTWFNHMTAAERNKAIADIFNNAKYEDIYGKYLWDDTGIDSAETLRQRGQAFAQAISSADNYDNLDYTTAAALGISNLKRFLERQEETPSTPTYEEKQEAAREEFFRTKRAEGFKDEAIAQLWNNRQSGEDRARRTEVETSNANEAKAQLNDEWNTWYSQQTPVTTGLAAPVYGGAALKNVDKAIEEAYKGDVYAFYDDALKILRGEINLKDSKTGQRMNDDSQRIQAIGRFRHATENFPDDYFAYQVGNDYVVPGTIDENYTAYVYNPSFNSYRQISLLGKDAYKDLVRKIWEERRAQSHKQGGVLKMQDGGGYLRSEQEKRESAMARFMNAQMARKEAEKKEQKARAERKGRTQEQQAYMETQVGAPGSTEFSAMDKWRLGNAAADIVSMISAYVPVYGTAASAVTGIGSTLSNLGADIAEDGFQWGDLGNFGLSLGMDVMGLIPGLGTASKVGKITKTLKTIIPTALLIWQASKADGAVAAGKKLMQSPDSMTREDWLELSNGIKLLLGGSNLLAGKIHAHNAAKDKIDAGKVYTFKTAKGERVALNQDQYSKVLAAGDGKKGKELLSAQNAKLKELMGNDVTVTQPFRDGIKYIGRRTTAMETTLYDRPDYNEIGWKPWNIGADGKPKSFSNYAIYDWTANIRPGIHIPNPFSNLHIGQTRLKPKASSKQAPKKRVQPLAEGDTKARAELEAANGVAQRPVTTTSASKVVADQTVPARMGLQDFIDTSIPSRPVTGAARNARQSMYDNLFQAVPQARVIPARPVSLTVPKAPTARQHAARQKALNEVFKAGPDPRAVIASNTKGAYTSVQKLIDSRLPKKPLSGAARQKRQKALEEVLGPVQKKDTRNTAAKKAAKTKAAKKSTDKNKKLASMGGTYKLGGRLIRRFDIGGSVDPYSDVTWGDERMAYVLDENGNLKLVPRETFATTTNGMRYKPEFDATTLEGTAGYKAYNQALEADDALLTKWLEDAVKYRKDDSDTRLLQFKNKETGQWDLAKAREALFRGKSYGNNKPGRLDTNAGLLHDVTKGQNYYYLDGDTKKYLGAVPKGYKATDQFTWSDDNLVKHILLERIADTKPASTEDTPSRAGVQNAETQQDTSSRAGTTAVAGERVKQGSGKGWNLLPEDVLAFSRMAMGLGANARAAEQQKAGLKPLLTDTWENVVSPEYDYIGDREAFDAKARLASFAGRARTANSQDQFAGELEAENRGNQFVAQQKVRSANRFYQTDRLRQQESDAAKARRVENANANMGRMLQTDAAKHQIDAALTTAQYAQVVAPWMAGIENQYRQNRAMQRQMDASAYQRNLMAQMQTDFDAAKAAGDTKKMQKITNKYQSDVEAYNRRMYSSPWLIQKTMQSPISSEFRWIDYAKQGGRLTAREREVVQRAKDFNKRMLEDNKQFHKDIMESKREHNKLIAGMSNLTADLIKNGMKWK